MAFKFVTSLDLNQNELLNPVLQNLASNPGTPLEGQIFWRSDVNRIRYYDGSTWIDIEHDSLPGFVANEHIDHSAVSINTAVNSGLAGGGNLTASRSLTLDFDNLATAASVDSATDLIAIYDASTGNTVTETIDNIISAAGGGISNAYATITGDTGSASASGSDSFDLTSANNRLSIAVTSGPDTATFTLNEGNIVHDNLSGFVANEHIDHSAVSITAGIGLSGGGNLTTTRTLNLDINGLTAVTTTENTDFIAIYDDSVGGVRKISYANFIDAAGDNLGNHTATQDLDMASFDVENVSQIRFPEWIAGSYWQIAASSDFTLSTGLSAATERFHISNSGVITINNAYALPSLDGANGQALITNGAGVISFQDISSNAYSGIKVGVTTLTATGEETIEFSSADGSITLTPVAGTPDDVSFEVNPANVDHDSLGGFVANEHIDHSAVSINAGTALTGGGNITTSRTINFDLTGLTSLGSAPATADTFIIYDADAGSHKKVTYGNLISGIVGGVTYQGTWNANTNSPSITGGSGTQGHYYVVSVAGSTNIDGITDWQVGDWIVYNGTAWEKVDNTDQVTSVFGRTGAVTAQASDYDADQVDYDNTTSGLTATDVQAAIDEVEGRVDTLEGVSHVSKYAATVSLGDTPGAQTVTHNLGTTDVVVMVYDTATKDEIGAVVDVTNTNSITVTGNGATISARVIVIG
jgi:hypothetical protein